ncbi:MAG: DUF3137 domain-containing protein [Candidatus Bathyarchaeia archaeon]
MDDYMIYVVIALSFVVIVSFFLGRVSNNRIQRKFWKALTQTLKSHCTTFKHVGFGSSGFKLACPTKRKEPLNKFEATLVLLDRENILHYPIQVLRGGYDQLIFKANFHKSPKARIEIMSKIEGKKVDRALKTRETLTEIKVGNGDLDKAFIVKTSNPRKAKNLLTNKSFLQQIQNLKEHVRRISIAPNEPHIYLICVADEKTVPQVVSFMFMRDLFLQIFE